jgi:methanogenic corrinoid protein MtbC1
VGTFVMGTVKGDARHRQEPRQHHVRGTGFTVIDLGVAPKFVEQIVEHKPDIVGFSAFLTATMPSSRRTSTRSRVGPPRRGDCDGRRRP